MARTRCDPGRQDEEQEAPAAARAVFRVCSVVGAPPHRETPGLARGEELVGIHLVAPAEEVLRLVVGRRAVDGLAVGGCGSVVVALAALECGEALLGGRSFT